MKKILLVCIFALCNIMHGQINTQISPYHLCIYDNNYQATFDLTTKIPEILGSLNPEDYTISFYQAGIALIDNPHSHTQIAYALTPILIKVKNNSTGDITNVNLQLTATLLPNINLQEIHHCNETNTGISTFSLSEISTQIRRSHSGLFSQYELKYFLNESNAENNSNPIISNEFINTVPFLHVIYARISSAECFKVIPVTLKVSACVTAGTPNNLTVCQDSTGTGCFNLSDNTPLILSNNSPAGYTVTYHQTHSDADANTGMLPLNNYCVLSGTEIFARLTHSLSGEYDISSFTITPSQVLIQTASSIIIDACDDDMDSILTFNLTDAFPAGTTYYPTQADAVAATNSITNPASFEVGLPLINNEIFARIIENCAVVKKIKLIAQSNCHNSYSCQDARMLCNVLGTPFPNTTGITSAEPGNAYGCLGTQPNPSWFYFQVGQSGNLQYLIEQNESLTFSNTTRLDVDYICYGPFTSPTQQCNNLTQANIVSCSFSNQLTETVNITNAVEGQYYLIMVTNYSNEPGYIRITETAQSQGSLTCSGLRMQAFIDNNNNGIKDADENGFNLGNFSYEVNNNGVVHILNDADGFYSLYDENTSNTYYLTFTVAPQYAAYYNLTTSYYTDVQVQPGTSVITYNFPVTIVQTYTDLSIHVIPDSSPRPGFNYKNTLVYTNLGNQTVASGNVSFVKDNVVTITNVSQTGTITTPTGFDYTFTNLLPNETRTIEVYMQVPIIPVVSLGQNVEASASILPLSGDIDTANNNSTNVQEIIGSYDPNDKMESRGEKILISEFGNNDYLYYTIRFQNTGTAPAEFVRIHDILDSQLDHNTVEMLRASHNYSLDRVNNSLTWKFDNIMLPATQDDEPASHGYVYFRVKPRPGFQPGDIIPNKASIFFDYNPAIVTNTFTTEFVSTLGNKENNISEFSLYPNPASGNVNIQLGNISDSIASVKIYDLTGKTIYLKENADGNLITLNINNFSTGAYMVEVITKNNFRSIKKLLVK